MKQEALEGNWKLILLFCVVVVALFSIILYALLPADKPQPEEIVFHNEEGEQYYSINEDGDQCWGNCSENKSYINCGYGECWGDESNMPAQTYFDYDVSYLEADYDDITKYYVEKYETRRYYCDDVAEDYWRYPSSYDNSFNQAYDDCIEESPSMFEREEIHYNETDYNNSVLFFSNNISISPNLLSVSEVMDIALQEINGTIIMYGMTCEFVSCSSYSDAEQCMECYKTEDN